ncbi:hypothetical protein [Clostridium sp. AN503]|uniref:hypothetical protein n=1 Tax=Clostridium sp. AN503 TaxID=3160598 RepID=UPI00345ABD91
MENDFKELIEEVIKKIKNDPQLLEKFNDDPVKALEDITGKDLPDQMIEPLIAGVNAKIGADELGYALGKLANLFGK